MNTTTIFNQVLSSCTNTFGQIPFGEKSCVAARNAVDYVPSVVQKAACWTGIVSYALATRWMSTYDKIGYYGEYCFEYGGYVGQTAWVGLSLLILVNLGERIAGRRDRVILDEAAKMFEQRQRSK